MKDLMLKVSSFTTFDLPLDINYLSEKFATIHFQQQEKIPRWSTKATRKKIIASYWFSHVLSHFIFLFGLPAFVFLVISRHFKPVNLAILFVDGIIVFSVLLLFQYWPIFYSGFLPHLETIKESYELKQLANLEKCKKAQLSNPALVMIYYVLIRLAACILFNAMINTQRC